MGKKADLKNADKILKLSCEQWEMVKNEAAGFYVNGELPQTISSPEGDPFSSVVTKIREDPDLQTFTDEKMYEQCVQIKENEKQGKAENIVISFVHGKLKHQGSSYDLDSAVIKAVIFNTNEPIFFHYRKGDSLNALIFVGGDEAQAYALTKDETGKEAFLRFSEFHLLSISTNSFPGNESGCMVSYLWYTAKVCMSVIMGSNLDAIKNLLLSEVIKAQAAAQQKRKK